MDPRKTRTMRALPLALLALAACAGNATPTVTSRPTASRDAPATSSTQSDPPAPAAANDAGKTAATAPTAPNAPNANAADPLANDKQLCLVVRRGAASLLRYRTTGKVVTIETGDVRDVLEGEGAAFLDQLLGRAKAGASAASAPRRAKISEIELDAAGRPVRLYVYDHRGTRSLDGEVDYDAAGRWKTVRYAATTHTFSWRGTNLPGGTWPPKKIFPARDLLRTYPSFGDAPDDGSRPFRLPFTGTLTIVRSAPGAPDTPFIRHTAQYDAQGRRTAENSEMFDAGQWRPLGTERTTWKGDELASFTLVTKDATGTASWTTDLDWSAGRMVAFSRKEKEKSSKEVRTTYAYDDRGRLISITGVGGPATLDYRCDDP